MLLAFKHLVKKWLDHDISFTAAGLTYYALFATIPLVSLFLTISTIFINEGFIASEISRYVDSIFSTAVAARINALVDSLVLADYSLTLSIGGIVALFYGVTSYFARLNEKIRTILTDDTPDNVYLDNLSRRLSALVYTFFIFIFLVLVSLSQLIIANLDVLLPSLFDRMFLEMIIEPLATIVSIGLFSGVVALLYRTIAKVSVPRYLLGSSALFVSVVIYVLNLVFSRALSFSATFQDYGLFSATLAVVIWIYLINQIILIGAVLLRYQTNASEASVPHPAIHTS